MAKESGGDGYVTWRSLLALVGIIVAIGGSSGAVFISTSGTRFREHEKNPHEGAVRREEYTRETDQIHDELRAINVKLDKLIQRK